MMSVCLQPLPEEAQDEGTDTLSGTRAQYVHGEDLWESNMGRRFVYHVIYSTIDPRKS